MKNFQLEKDLAIIRMKYIKEQNEYGLSDTELVAIIKIETLINQNEEFNDFMSKQQITTNTIKSLQEKGILTITKTNGSLNVEINDSIKEKSSVNSNQNELNRESIDRINFLLNRKIQMYELDKINRWLTLNYSIEQIETAISKSMINDVDNINYIEKVLFNCDTNVKQNLNIERNFDLY